MNKPLKFLALAVLAAMGSFGCSRLVDAQDLHPTFAALRLPEKQKEKGGKLAFFNDASRLYLGGATAFDMWSTAGVIDHPTVASTENDKFLAYYQGQEVGWSGIFGRRNMFAVTTANVALNSGLTLFSRHLYQKGGRWRVLAIVVTAAKGTDNLVAGIENVRYSGTIDGKVRKATGYNGPIVWSH